MEINLGSFLNWVTPMSALIASIVGIVTIIILIVQSRLTKRTIEISVLLDLEKKFEEPPMIQKRKNASRSLLSKKNLRAADDVLNYFELIGLLLCKGALDKEMITSEFSRWAYSYWYASKEHIDDRRRRDRFVWLHYQFLIESITKVNKQFYKNPSDYLPSEEGIKAFLLAVCRRTKFYSDLGSAWI